MLLASQAPLFFQHDFRRPCECEILAWIRDFKVVELDAEAGELDFLELFLEALTDVHDRNTVQRIQRHTATLSMCLFLSCTGQYLIQIHKAPAIHRAAFNLRLVCCLALGSPALTPRRMEDQMSRPASHVDTAAKRSSLTFGHHKLFLSELSLAVAVSPLTLGVGA